MNDTIKTKKPRYKKTNVKVVDAKTGEKKDDGSTGAMDAENFINYINMKYPNYNTSQTPNAKRNRRQSAKALEIINSRKKAKAPKKKITSTKKAGGGKVKNRNIGGVIGGGLGSQDVVDYLYNYKS